MTRDEVKAMLATMETVYPGCFRHETDDAARQRIDFWAVALKNEPAQEVRDALVEASKVCEFSPSIADIFKQLRARRAGSLPSEAELWRITNSIARKIRANNERAAYGGYIDAAGKHSRADLRAENQTLFDSLPAPVKEWAGSPSELAAVLDREDGELEIFVRPGFKKAMEKAKADAVKAIEALPPGARPAMEALPPPGN